MRFMEVRMDAGVGVAQWISFPVGILSAARVCSSKSLWRSQHENQTGSLGGMRRASVGGDAASGASFVQRPIRRESTGHGQRNSHQGYLEESPRLGIRPGEGQYR